MRHTSNRIVSCRLHPFDMIKLWSNVSSNRIMKQLWPFWSTIDRGVISFDECRLLQCRLLHDDRCSLQSSTLVCMDWHHGDPWIKRGRTIGKLEWIDWSHLVSWKRQNTNRVQNTVLSPHDDFFRFKAIDLSRTLSTSCSVHPISRLTLWRYEQRWLGWRPWWRRKVPNCWSPVIYPSCMYIFEYIIHAISIAKYEGLHAFYLAISVDSLLAHSKCLTIVRTFRLQRFELYRLLLTNKIMCVFRLSDNVVGMCVIWYSLLVDNVDFPCVGQLMWTWCNHFSSAMRMVTILVHHHWPCRTNFSCTSCTLGFRH